MRGWGQRVYTFTPSTRSRISWGSMSAAATAFVGRVNKSSLLSATSTLSTQLDKLLLPLGKHRPRGRSTTALSFRRARSCFRLASEIAIEGCRDGENFADSPLARRWILAIILSRGESFRGSEAKASRDPFAVIAHVQLHNWCERHRYCRSKRGASRAHRGLFITRDTLFPEENNFYLACQSRAHVRNRQG